VVDPAETERVLAGLTGTRLHTHVVTAASDPAGHVLAGDALSPGTNDTVRAVMRDFLEVALGTVPDMDRPEPPG
jgi:hypothetical protein